MSSDSRIDQFRKMVESNPNDELAHLSLGNALLDAGQFKDAAQSFQRVLALNGQLSKAYQLLGAAQKGCGDTELAIQTLRNGFIVAHRKGDLMPRNAMEAMLKELGAEVPAVGQKPAATGDAGTDASGFTCRRCGAAGPKLGERPFKGALGEQVLASVCANCWREWVGMGTKVINELRLPMFDPQAQEMYDKHMREFLSLDA